MGLPEAINRRYASIAAITLAIVWLWVAFDRPYTFPKHIPWNISSNTAVPPTFISDSLNSATSTSYTHDSPTTESEYDYDLPIPTAIDNLNFPPVDSDAIRNICSGTKWNPDLVFICDNSKGNIAHVRNGILTCVRYAIEAGANLVVPRIINKDGAHTIGMTVLDYDRQDFAFMFDEAHFVDSLHRSCPEMTVYEDVKQVPFPDNDVRPPIVTIYPEKLALRKEERWRDTFDQLITDMIAEDEDTLPIMIEMGRPGLKYDIYSDGTAFANAFGNILKFNQAIRVLASKVLLNLGAKYNITLTTPTPIIPHAFFGAHLFTEEEMFQGKEGWPDVEWEYTRFEPEARHYLDQAANASLSVIYAASNRGDEITRFTKDATGYGMIVHSKYDLLGDDRKMLGRLTIDQRDMIDYLVLCKASVFGGIGHSALSWNVAARRHLNAEQEGMGQWLGWQDGLSRVWGEEEGEGSWHHMWP